MIQTILDNLVRRNLKIIYIDRIFLFCHKNQLMSLDLEFHLHIFQPFIYVSIIAFSGCPLCVPCTAKSELGLMDQTAIEVGPGVDQSTVSVTSDWLHTLHTAMIQIVALNCPKSPTRGDMD